MLYIRNFAFVKRLVFYIIAVLLSSLFVEAQNLSRECAVRLASDFLNSKGLANSKASAAAKSKHFVPSDFVIAASSSNMQLVAEEGGGSFALVCGTDEDARIAGYGFYSDSQVPDALNNIIRYKPAPISSVSQNVLWAMEDGVSLPIAPIVKSVRSQDDPFNRSCPHYIYDDGVVSQELCLVGCVATAAEQLVSHYRYPDALLDSIAGFSSDNNGVIPTIPAGTKLNFDNILDIYKEGQYTDAQAQAVADLSYYLGVACRMSWGIGSSGANLSRLVEPLRRAFGYKYVRRVGSYDYSPRQWYRLLLNELSNERPILYAGYTSHGGGHAFVVDGMNAEGYFHITWGYGGDYDGYFDLSVLTPQESPLEPTLEGTIWGLNHLQEALFLNPDSVKYDVNDTMALEHRIEVDTIIFNRHPDTNIYVTAEIKVSNISDEDTYSPVELFTYTRLDTLGMPADMDYLGVADAVVKAHSDTTLIAYLSFTDAGERYLGINLCDSIYLPYDSLQITKASQPKLAFEVKESEINADNAAFEIEVSNLSAAYWSGRMITYSIFEGDYTVNEGDLRHFTVINLPPNESMRDNVSFQNLKPDTKYTFVVRNPWNPALQMPFTTPKMTAVEEVVATEDGENALSNQRTVYRLNNRIVIKYDESTGRYRQVLSPQR